MSDIPYMGVQVRFPFGGKQDVSPVGAPFDMASQLARMFTGQSAMKGKQNMQPTFRAAGARGSLDRLFGGGQPAATNLAESGGLF